MWFYISVQEKKKGEKPKFFSQLATLAMEERVGGYPIGLTLTFQARVEILLLLYGFQLALDPGRAGLNIRELLPKVSGGCHHIFVISVHVPIYP